MKKATRQEKRFLAKHEVKRERISRESKYDREKKERLQKAIEKSKRLKREANQTNGDHKVEDGYVEDVKTDELAKKKKKKSAKVKLSVENPGTDSSFVSTQKKKKKSKEK
jgi:hypothetical protein